MRKTLQIRYCDFVEIFDVKITGSELKVSLLEITDKLYSGTDVITLDFVTDIEKGYSIFPFESGDLGIIQIKNFFILSAYIGSRIHWFRFDSSQVISFLLKQDLIRQIVPYIDEDEHLFINSILSDLVRTDYSFSSYNKKVKFTKLAVLMNFVKDSLNLDYERVILDETVLGDVDIENISIAFRFAGKKFIRLVKIDNLTKAILALEKEKLIYTKFKFTDRSVLINLGDNGDTCYVKFQGQESENNFQIFPKKNYVFDLGNKEYVLSIDDYKNILVRGKVFVFNGDERNFLIN